VKKIIYLFLLIILGVALQTTILASPGLSNVAPNLILLLTVFAGFYWGETKGSLTGFFGGILLDSFSAYPVGLGAFSQIIAGTLSGILGGRLHRESVPAQSLVTFIASTAFFLSFFLLKLAFELSPFITLLEAALSVVINTILAPFFFYLLKRLIKEGERRVSRSSWKP
jgi:rod shape-determining protein MreD